MILSMSMKHCEKIILVIGKILSIFHVNKKPKQKVEEKHDAETKGGLDATETAVEGDEQLRSSNKQNKKATEEAQKQSQEK